MIQFRVPSHLVGVPPFGSREIFRRSTGTKDIRVATAERDRFLREVGFFAPEEDAEERRANRDKSVFDHYWETHGGIDRSVGYDKLEELLHTVEGMIQDFHDSGRTIQNSPEMRKREAQYEAIRRVLSEMALSPLEMSNQPHKYEITLSVAANNLTREMIATGKASKTVGKVGSAVRRLTGFLGRDATLTQIRKPLVRQHISRMRQAGLSQATVSNDLSFLGSLYSLAQQEGYLAEDAVNPFREHRLNGFGEPTRRQIYTSSQLIGLLRTAESDKEVISAIYLGYYSGMRLDEAFNCRLIEQDRALLWSVAEGGTGKTRAATRLIPLHPECGKALRALKMLPTVGSRVPWSSSSSQALGKRFGRLKAAYFKSAGLSQHEAYTFHSLRHGFASLLAEKGHSELRIADLTGHDRAARAISEAGRTYIAPLDIASRVEMVANLPTLPPPSEIGFTGSKKRRKGLV